MKKRIAGKIVGGLLGLLAGGGPMSAALGLAIGHAYDNRPDEARNDFWQTMRASHGGFGGSVQQAAFSMGVIVLGAKMAKADGSVTREEIEAFKRVFRVPQSQVDNVGRLFDQARRSAEGFEPYAMRLAQLFKRQPVVLEQILSGLFIIATSDGPLSRAELRFLERVANIFGFSPIDFARIAARSGVRLGGAAGGGGGRTPFEEKTSSQSYAILGIREQATVVEIKSAYRALIRKHHPDKLVAQGMAPEFIAVATEKMKRINAAYDEVCKVRGIK